MSGITFKGDKLVGRSNYIEWLTNATLFFEINGYMSYIDGSESEPDKNLYYKDEKIAYSPELAVKYIERLSEYQRNNTRALGAIKSVISLDNTERFKDKKSAKDLFDAIKSTFGESSLELIGRYLDRILEADYTSFKSMDEYTSQIQSSAIYLKELSYEVPRPFLAWLLFKGLPSAFDSFNSRKYEELAKDLTKVDISKLIADLISEEARMNASQSLEANRATRAKDSFCRHCKIRGHLEARCYKKYPELKPREPSSSSKPKKGSKEDPDSDNDSSKKSKSTKVIMSTIADSRVIEEVEKSSPTIYFSRSNDFKNKLVLDSGATEHYTPNKDWLLDYKEVSNKSIVVANGDKIAVEGIGNIPIFIENKEVLISRVNYIPSIKTTLISSRELAKKGWETIFKDTRAIISHNKAKLKVVANWVSNAYYIDIKINFNILEPIVYKMDPILMSTGTTSTTSSSNDLDLYHKRLLHINKDYLVKTIDNVLGLKPVNTSHILHNCDSCHFSKFSRTISREPLLDNGRILTILDIDIAGPFKVKGLKGERYFLTITDRASRAIWVYPIKYKSDALDILTRFYTLIETQFGVKILVIRLDNAGEFKSNKWSLFCTSKGIICEYTSPYTAYQNGIAERLNRYILERLIAISSEKNIPLKLWPYLVQAIAHIKNRTYNPTIGKTPYEVLAGTKPNIGYIKIIGSLTYVLEPKETRTKTALGKLAYRANKGILISFRSSKNFLVYIPSTDQIVDSSSIDIKENLIYTDDYIIEEDYSNLLETNSPDFDYIRPLAIPNTKTTPDPTNTSTSDHTSPSSSDEEDSNELGQLPSPSTRTIPVVEIPSYTGNRPLISQQEDNPELDSEEDTITVQPRYTRDKSDRLKTKEPINYKGFSIYSLASIAYLDSLNKGDSDQIYSTTLEELNDELSLNTPSSPQNELVPTLLNFEAKSLNSTSTSTNSSSNLPTIFKEPKSYKEAISSIYKDQWLESMKIEYNSLNKNKTWDLVPLPKGAKALKTRWVYKIKNPNNSQDISDITFKSRFVAKGFEQLYGLDYLETFAAVIKQMAWKLIFALAILNNWLIYKIDMISAFTQGNIDSYLYLIQPRGFEDSNNPDYVLRLNKALYGLKQSARIWYYTLKDILVDKLGFTVLYSESCIYINRKLNIIICLYVDDLAIVAPSLEIISTFISQIKKYFNIKDLGLIKDYLGIDIDLNLDKGYIKLSQAKYIDKVLAKFSMESSNPVFTPMDSRTKLEPYKEEASKNFIKLFQSIIGSLLYITLGTRPDIAYATIKLARYASNPSPIHITSAKRILRYLKATKDYGITYYSSYTSTSSNKYISGYCDADYAGDIFTAKSTLGWIFFIAGGPISWKSKLQSIIAQSTTESEYIAINSATKEAVFIKQLMTELGAYNQAKFPIYTDNEGALALAKNPVFHERTKHIAVKYHYIRQLIEEGTIDLVYINTKDQKSDGLTKPLDKTKFKEFLIQLGLYIKP